MTKCYICGRRKDDIHEVFGGSNRQKSIIWGLVIPICRKCHDDWDIVYELRKAIRVQAKKEFIKKYGEEQFLKEFGKNFI